MDNQKPRVSRLSDLLKDQPVNENSTAFLSDIEALRAVFDEAPGGSPASAAADGASPSAFSPPQDVAPSTPDASSESGLSNHTAGSGWTPDGQYVSFASETDPIADEAAAQAAEAEQRRQAMAEADYLDDLVPDTSMAELDLYVLRDPEPEQAPMPPTAARMDMIEAQVTLADQLLGGSPQTPTDSGLLRNEDALTPNLSPFGEPVRQSGPARNTPQAESVNLFNREDEVQRLADSADAPTPLFYTAPEHQRTDTSRRSKSSKNKKSTSSSKRPMLVAAAAIAIAVGSYTAYSEFGTSSGEVQAQETPLTTTLPAPTTTSLQTTPPVGSLEEQARAIVDGDSVVLVGTVPSEEVHDAYVNASIAIAGNGSTEDRMTVDNSLDTDDSSNELRFEITDADILPLNAESFNTDSASGLDALAAFVAENPPAVLHVTAYVAPSGDVGAAETASDDFTNSIYLYLVTEAGLPTDSVVPTPQTRSNDAPETSYVELRITNFLD